MTLDDPDDRIEIIPSTKPERVYIAGMNGMGKSYQAKVYARQYRELFPDRRIILISRHEDDDTYEDGTEIEQFTVDADFGEKEITLDQLRDTLVIFDDIDNLQDAKLSKMIHRIIDDIAGNGRKYGIHMVYLSHLICAGNKTKGILNEAAKIIIFPGGATGQNEYFMSKYMRFSASTIRKITALKDKSRWVMLARAVIPNYVVYEKGIFLL
jgi:hypothetical protein